MQQSSRHWLNSLIWSSMFLFLFMMLEILLIWFWPGMICQLVQSLLINVWNQPIVLYFSLLLVHPLALMSITYWKWKSIDLSSVQADISDEFEDFAYQNIDTAARTYNSTLADIIDNHAPKKTLIVTVRAENPWYTAELSQEKRLRR